MDEEGRRRVAAVFNGVAHPTRIAVLEGVQREASIGEMAADRDVARGTVQSHLETLIESDLVYRPSEDGRTYAVTPLGEHVLKIVDAEVDAIVDAVERVDEAREEERAELEPAVELVDEIDEAEWERTVDTRAWEQVWTDVAERLKDS